MPDDAAVKDFTARFVRKHRAQRVFVWRVDSPTFERFHELMRTLVAATRVRDAATAHAVREEVRSLPGFPHRLVETYGTDLRVQVERKASIFSHSPKEPAQ